ncbi:hypothetical protein ABW20_dc0107182 [Dactylellina cionopaga]|nr:hypothetical protein ABW20_dc0107182 [Dactylellina cionopaga]
MQFTINVSIVLSILSLTQSISGHAFIYNARGNSEPSCIGWALGYHKNTPRGKGDQLPFQRDVAVFKNPAVPKYGKKRDYLTDGCGLNLYNINRYQEVKDPARYKKSGGKKNDWYYKTKYVSQKPFINIAKEVGKMAQEDKIPKASQGGWISFTTFQINDDGAGPFRCKLDTAGDATKWSGWLKVTDQAPGQKKYYSVYKKGNQKAHSVKVKLPNSFTCKGSYYGFDNVCILRCENFAKNGPFGGCIPFQQTDGLVKPKPVKPVLPPVEEDDDETDYDSADSYEETPDVNPEDKDIYDY